MRYDDWNTAFMLNNQVSQYLVNRINHKISTQKRKKIARVSKKNTIFALAKSEKRSCRSKDLLFNDIYITNQL